MNLPPIKFEHVACKGGLDQITPTQSLKPGFARKPKRQLSDEQREKQKERCRIWHAKHRDSEEYKQKNSLHAKKYRINNPDKVREIKRLDQERNKEKYKQIHREHYLENKDAILEKNLAYRKLHRAEIAISGKIYREKNKEKLSAKRLERMTEAKIIAGRERAKQWAADNREKRRIQNQNRKALIKSSGGKLSPDLIPRLMTEQSGLCNCCKSSLESTGYHLDHIVALAKQGKHEDSNIQLLCPRCNMSKKDKDFCVFLQMLRAA